MNSTVIIAVISFLGTMLGTVGGIVASSKLTNYRLEQLEKKVDAFNASSSHIPVIEERMKSLDRRILNVEKGDIKYDCFKGNNYQNMHDCDCFSQSTS